MTLETLRAALSMAMRFQLLDLPCVVNGFFSSAHKTIIARIWLQLENIPLKMLAYGEEGRNPSLAYQEM
jgi:hypothetical protein